MSWGWLRAPLLALTLLLTGCGSCQQPTEPIEAGDSAATTPQAKIRPALMPTADSGFAKGRIDPPTVAAGTEFPTPEAIAQPAEEVDSPLDDPLLGDPAGGGDCIAIIDADPDFGEPPLSVSFSVEAQCSAGAPTFTWNFGDDSPPLSEPAPVHIFEKVGEYTVRLQAVGPDGSVAADDIDITVEEGASPE